MWNGKLFNAFLETDRQGYASVAPPVYPDGIEIVDCALGTNPLGTSDALRARLKELGGVSLCDYPEPEPEGLKKSIAARYPAWRIAPENVFTGAGSMAVLTALARLLAAPGARFAGICPQFTEGVLQSVYVGAEYVAVPLAAPRYALSTAAIFEVLEQRPAFLYLDRPNNPTGQLLPLKHLEAIAQKAMEVGCWVVSDEAYADFVSDEESAACLDLPNLVTCRSFSKGLGAAGLRVGYAVTRHPKLIASLRKLLPLFAVPTLSIPLAETALNDADFLDRTRAYVRTAKEKILKALEAKPEWSVAETDVRVPILFLLQKEGDLVQRLADKGIACEPGLGFFDHDNRAVRLRVPSPAQLDEFLRRIALL